MIGTIVVASAALPLVLTAVMEVADAIVDHRRLKIAPQRSAAPRLAAVQSAAAVRRSSQQPAQVFAKAA